MDSLLGREMSYRLEETQAQRERIIALAPKAALALKAKGQTPQAELVLRKDVSRNNPHGTYKIIQAWPLCGVEVFLAEYGRIAITAIESPEAIEHHKEWWNKPRHRHRRHQKRIFIHVKQPDDLLRFTGRHDPTLNTIETSLNEYLA